MAEAGKAGAGEADRLEAALERIANSGLAARDPASRANTVELAHRLDVLIAELRAVLGRDSAD